MDGETCQVKSASAVAECDARFLVSMTYVPHGGWPSPKVSKVVEPHKRLLLADAGAISINKIVSAEGDEQPDRAPEVRVSTDITRCGKTVMALVGIVVVFDTVLVRCEVVSLRADRRDWKPEVAPVSKRRCSPRPKR
jgi:hypothetical protein